MREWTERVSRKRGERGVQPSGVRKKDTRRHYNSVK